MALPIIKKRPPNFDKIVKVFPMAVNDGVIFAYDNAIYNPSGGEISPALQVHEAVHARRQREIGVDHWWHLYLCDEKFRYEEELLAHRAEYHKAMDLARRSRQQKRSCLRVVAKRLASPLYGKMASKKKAMLDILGEE